MRFKGIILAGGAGTQTQKGIWKGIRFIMEQPHGVLVNTLNLENQLRANLFFSICFYPGGKEFHTAYR